MAIPVGAAVARKLYRDAAGRFISKAKYELNQRRNPATGRFMPKSWVSSRLDPTKVENYLRAQLGAPPAGKNWSQIASKYPQRFADYLDDLEAA